MSKRNAEILSEKSEKLGSLPFGQAE